MEVYGCIPLNYVLGIGSIVTFLGALLLAFLLYRKPRD